VKVHDWHRNGLQPSFATIEQWIHDQLGLLGAEDEAVYAITIRDETARAGLAIRILIASDRGLFDMLWERPDAVEGRHLTSRHHRWSDVRGLHISGATRLSSETLMRKAPEWRIQIEEPDVQIDATESVAGLEFWQTCMEHLGKEGRR
jgi:hypothetical protein